jgi:hypothetical protein
VLDESSAEGVLDFSALPAPVVVGADVASEVVIGSGSATGPPRSSLKSPILSGVTWFEIKIESTKIIEIP